MGVKDDGWIQDLLKFELKFFYIVYKIFIGFWTLLFNLYNLYTCHVCFFGDVLLPISNPKICN